MTRFTEQVRPVVEPSSIRGLPNGDYPASALTDITDAAGKVVGRLCREAARAWQAMVAHAASDGIDLRPTSSADTFRPIAVQRRIFAERYRETDQGNGSRVCSGKRWWKRKGVATAACPGTSNHGKAIAIDVANCSGARLAWLERNAWSYGFAWELVPEEPWHIRYCTGDAIPAAVLAYERGTAALPNEDDLTFIWTPDGKVVLLHAGKLVWIASPPGIDVDGVNYWHLEKDGETWRRLVKAYGQPIL